MFTPLKRMFSIAPTTPIVPSTNAHPYMRDEPKGSFLWIDRPEAKAGLWRRRLSGEISREQVRALEHWAEHGYVVFEGCIPHEVIDAALDDLDRFWRERRHISIDLLTTGERTFMDAVPPETQSSPVKINDLYLYSDAVRRIMLDEQIVRFGELIFGDQVVGCNSLMFEYGTQQPPHVDHIYMTPTPARRLFAAWVACEDIDPEAGPLEFWPGSHRLAPYDFGASGYHYTPEQDVAHSEYIAEQVKRFEKREFIARKGDVLLWHAMLIHAGGKVDSERRTRRSMAFHYYSRECIGDGRQGVADQGSALYLTKDT
jgi:phytanoyl-CoA hydroxylase